MEITDTAYPDTDVASNARRWIAGNSAFFKELWLTAWDLFARLSLNAKQHGFGTAIEELGQSQGGRQPKWTGELLVAMMQFPMALSRCGISEEMQTTFMEAIKTLNDLKVKFHIPHDGHAVTDQ